jgi:hypothetical protein
MAEAPAAKANSSKYTEGYKPWKGYFEELEGIEIPPLEVC